MHPDNARQQVLKFHVHGGLIMSSDLTNGQHISTLEGNDVTVSFEGDVVKANRATVISADANACNGVAHIIDEVLIPPPLRKAVAHFFHDHHDHH